MAQKYTTHVIRGELHWAKVLGAPIMNEYAKERQWSIDVSPDAAGLAELKKLKLGDKIKDKKDGRGPFISFRQGEFKKNGEPNDPITIVDARNRPWPKDMKIGNKSFGEVKFSYTDFGSTKGNYIKAIRVLKHVPFVSQEFAPLSEDDEFFAASTEGNEEPTAGTADESAAPSNPAGSPSSAQDVELDDDVPF